MADEEYLGLPLLGEMLGVPDVPPRRRESDLLDYYLGPTGIPDRLGAANELLNPITSLSDAMYYSGRAFSPDLTPEQRREAAMEAALGTAEFGAGALGGKLAVKYGGDVADEVIDLLTAGLRAPLDARDMRQRLEADEFFGRYRDALNLPLEDLKGRQFYSPGTGQSFNELEARASRGDPEAMAYFSALNKYLADNPTDMVKSIEDYGVLPVPRLNAAGEELAPSYPLYITPDPVAVSKSAMDAVMKGQTIDLTDLVRGGAENLAATRSAYRTAPVFRGDDLPKNVAGVYRPGAAPFVTIRPGRSDPARAQTAVHEAQHALMDEKGVPDYLMGSSSKYVSGQIKAKINKLDARIKDTSDKAEKKKLLEYRKTLQSLSSREAYYRNPGEQLARISQGNAIDPVRLTPRQVMNPYIFRPEYAGGKFDRAAKGLMSLLGDTRFWRDIDRRLENAGLGKFSGNEFRGYDVHRAVPLDPRRSIAEP